jgi:ferredoxin
MLDFLKDRVSPKGVYLKAFSCAGCGYCAESCLQVIDPLLIHEAPKIELVEQEKRSFEAGHPVLLERGLKFFDIFLRFKKIVNVAVLRK